MTLSYRTRTRFKRFATILSVVLVLTILVWLFWLIWLDRYIKYDRHHGAVLDFSLSSTFAPPVAESVPNTKQPVRFEDAPRPEPSAPVEQTSIRGYYIDFDVLKKDMDAVQAHIDALPKGTAVVLDVKNALGGFHYSSAVGDKHSGSVNAARFDAFLKHLSERDLHLIARLPAFRDRHYGLNHIPQGLPIKGGDGALWPDSGGCYWLKPTSDTVLNYLINIAKELRSLGFDEVVFTEFRFPDTDKIVFTADKAQAITDAAAALVAACATDDFWVSFTGTATFPLPQGNSRLYMENVPAADLQAIAEQVATDDPSIHLLFYASSDDTRYDNYCVLRPLASAE